MDGDNLHVSSFVLVKDEAGDSIALLRVDLIIQSNSDEENFSCPPSILNFGESPKSVAQQLLGEQMNVGNDLKVEFVSMQSYLGAHWDIVFIFEAKTKETTLVSKEPFVEVSFYKTLSLPRGEIAEDHLEVLDELSKEQSTKS